jgi:translocation and assembly module TamA
MKVTRAPAALLLAAGLWMAAASAAPAFDFFGLWPGAEPPPKPSSDLLPYVVKFTVEGSGPAPETLSDASSLQSLRKDPPSDGDALARRARRDFAPLVDALWAQGYFEASLVIAIDGAALPMADVDAPAFVRAAEAYRDRAPVPILVTARPGPVFALGELKIVGRDGASLSQSEFAPREVGVRAGDPADSGRIRAAETRIVDYFRARSRPLAKIVKVAPVVDHPRRVLDVTIVVDPGPVAGFGPLKIVGPEHFDPAIVKSFIYLEEGELYTPKALADAKLSVRQIPAVGSTRIVEGAALDPDGRLPVEMDVGDRPAHAIGASLQYSSVDGPSARVYWEDRNLFGGAEYLRLEADVAYARANSGAAQRILGVSDADLGGRVAAHFLKPALGGSRDDLLIDAYAERATTNSPGFIGYTVDDADVTATIRHRFSQQLSAQIGLEAQAGVATDAVGAINYRLIGVPISLIYDSTDDKLDPTRGARATLSFAAYPTLLGSTLDLYQTRARGSAYWALDSDARWVLAGRIDIGSEFGSRFDQIPANLRYYAGGGGSVRGYAYDSLGPTGPGGAILGGRGVFDGSVEARYRMTDTLGFAPFLDAGDAFQDSAPDFSRPLQFAAGVGLRYYTAIGPLRLDVATPINPRRGDAPVAVYASVGQSF